MVTGLRFMQSAAVFLGPLLAGVIGWEGVFHAVATLLVASAIGFALLARDAPARGAPKGIGAMASILFQERLSWALAAFYFLTFGGFVAFSIYLPTLLKDDFGLTPTGFYLNDVANVNCAYSGKINAEQGLLMVR